MSIVFSNQKQNGFTTCSAPNTFIAILRLLDIPARPLVERERTYIAAWQDMGFDNEALRLAYEKTVMKKQSMDWGYMNGILRRWHEKGLHTVAAIQAGDGLRRNRGGAPTQGRTPQPGDSF